MGRLDGSASGEDIISTGEVTNTKYSVGMTFFSVHEKKGADPLHPKSMRVDYSIAYVSKTKSEWVFPEHDGWLRKRFESWWRNRCLCPPPQTAEEAVEIARDHLLAVTTEITVAHKSGERFDKIVDYKLGPIPTIPEEGSETCVHCLSFDESTGRCMSYNMQTQPFKTACENFVDKESIPF